MALQDVFLTPAGLLALAAVVPLLLLYLLRPDPRRMTVPTFEFLSEASGASGQSSALKRLRRSLLLLLQLLVVVLLALALASPYLTVPEAAGSGGSVVVVDATASMATETGDGTRFEAAVAAAREAVTESTTVVVAGASTRTVVRGGDPRAARAALDDLSVTDAPGDLRDAVARASEAAGAEDTIRVFSDFADDSNWRGAVTAAEVRGQSVELRQVAGGGAGNVGIVDLAFAATEVRVTVANTGRTAATRTIRFGGETTRVRLQPGDVVTRAFPRPTAEGTVTLSPADAFPTDDRAVVVVPPDPTVDALVLTGSEDRFLATALDVLPEVEVTVKRPPASVSREYDLVVFGDVDPTRVLNGTIETARETVAGGGGVVIRAGPRVGAVGYGDLLPVEPGQVRNTSGIRTTGGSLTAGIDFPVPDRHVTARTTRGTAQVTAEDGSPLIATAAAGEGRVLYYGYLPNASTFPFNYRYPVFWRRAVNDLVGRSLLSELNRETGATARFDAERVRGPGGEYGGPTVLFADAGVYEGEGGRRVGANLLDPAESNVTAPAVATDPVATADERTASTRPLDLTPLAALLALLVAVVEIGLLRYRGDL